MSRYQRSQAAKRRKIDAEPGSCCSTDEEESDSEIGAQECSTMTDLSGDDVLKLQDECQLLRAENHRLKDSADCLTEASFQNNDAKVKFYTGLPSFATLISVFTFVSAHVITAPQASLTMFQQFVMVLMKLRLNLANQDLAYRFGVHQASVSRNFRKWIDVMYRRLRPLIIWPTREELLKTMPVAFRKSFRRCVVIIDCFEVFCERPANLKARAQTWSNYKHHNTVKFLIGISPQGVVSFVSKGWGGRVSDVFLTENCGFLQKLLPGDLVLADRGFTVQDSAGVYCAEAKVPAFTRGKRQLSHYEVDSTRRTAAM